MKNIFFLILFINQAFAVEFCGKYKVQGYFYSALSKHEKKSINNDILILNPNAKAAINLQTLSKNPNFMLYDQMLVNAEIEIDSPDCSFSCFGKIISINKLSDLTYNNKPLPFIWGSTIPDIKMECLKKRPNEN